jgi:hypothetical protein
MVFVSPFVLAIRTMDSCYPESVLKPNSKRVSSMPTQEALLYYNDYPSGIIYVKLIRKDKIKEIRTFLTRSVL